MLPALFLPLAIYLNATPSFAAGPTRVELGPLVGDLTLPSGWASAGTGLAAKLLKQDGVREPPALSFLKGENEVVFATTKVTEGIALTAADLAGGGQELAKALGIAPSAIQCNAFPHPRGGFEFSICETIAAGTGLTVTGKGKPTAAIWVDIPLTYQDGQGRVSNSWTSIYFRGPGATMAAGHEIVEALLDSLTLKTGLSVVTKTTAAVHADGGAALERAPAASPAPPVASSPPSTTPASDSKRLAELLTQGLIDKPSLVNVAALRSVSEAYSGTVLGVVAAELSRHAAAQVALSIWGELLAKSPGDPQMRSLALRFFGAALRTVDIETMTETSRWLASHHVNLAELQPQELALVFPASDLCAAPTQDLPKSARDLGSLDQSKIDSSRRIVELFRSRGLMIPDLSTVAIADTAAVWKPRGDRSIAIQKVFANDGHLGTLNPRDPAKVRAGYDFRPFANIFDALEALCRVRPAGFPS
jgi:hypothetical protein